MRTWPVRLTNTILTILLLVCFLFPFRTVSLGMNTSLTIPGYAMLFGFSFSTDGAGIMVPGQFFYILCAIGALILAMLALLDWFRANRSSWLILAALAGMMVIIGLLGQSMLEPGAYAANSSLPRIVRDLFNGPRLPAAVAVNLLGLLVGLYAIIVFLTGTPRGIRLWQSIVARRLNAAMAALSGLALLIFCSPLKQIETGSGERLVIYGFNFLTGTTVSSGGETAQIPPQPFMIAFVVLAVLTIILSLMKLPGKVASLLIVLPALAGLSVFGQILFEMFVYNPDKSLPAYVRQLLSGKYNLVVFLAIGMVFVAAVAGILSLIIENNAKVSKRMQAHLTLYWFMLPGIALFFLFNYLPMFGVVMAFQQFDPVAGFFKSPWVGFQNFLEIFKLPSFRGAFRNTLIISMLRLIIEFPMPIIFSLMLNEIRMRKFKRTVQSVSYLPNFISWVIVSGIWYQMLSPDTGVINQVLVGLGLTGEPIFFMQEKSLFYPVLVFTSIWKNLGFASILYMASIAAIDQEQYEAAVVDGAGRIQQMVHITLPGMKNTIVLLFILAVAGLLNAGFDQIWTMGNTAIRDISEILDTLVLRLLTRGSFRDLSIGAAMGMFKSVVGLILFFTANLVSKKLNQDSLI